MTPDAGGVEDGVLSPEEAFALLGDETRMEILLALWEEFSRYGFDEAMTFSDLYARSDSDDTGNFNYHLGKLTGQFVQQTDEGYRLTESGFRLANAIAGGATTEAPIPGPTPVDAACPNCESPLELVSADETVWVVCTGCEGYYAAQERAVAGFQLPPEGVRARSPEGILDASVAYTVGKGRIMENGVCPECGGETDQQFLACDDHDPSDGICDTCGSRFAAVFRFVCSTCRNDIIAPGWAPLSDHPALIAFYHEHGVEHRENTWASMRRVYGWEIEPVDDPPVLEVTVCHEGDELTATIDESATVTHIEW